MSKPGGSSGIGPSVIAGNMPSVMPRRLVAPTKGLSGPVAADETPVAIAIVRTCAPIREPPLGIGLASIEDAFLVPKKVAHPGVEGVIGRAQQPCN